MQLTQTSSCLSVLVIICSLLCKDVAATPVTIALAAGDATHETATLTANDASNTDKTFIAGAATALPAGGTWAVAPSDGAEHVSFTISGSSLAASTEYTVTLAGLAPGTDGTTGGTIQNSPATAEGTICTKGAPLGLTLGPVSAEDLSIQVTWTKADGESNPSMYTLMVGDETIANVPHADDAEYTFTKSDAAGTALKLDTDYKCKISAEVPIFGASNGCAMETLTDEVDCKITSSAKALAPTLLMISIIFTILFE